MSNNSEVLTLANGSSGSVIAAPEPTLLLNACCLWCARTYTTYYRQIDPEILLHGSQTTVLDRGATLDDAGDRDGPNLGRLLEGVSHERARCLRGVPATEDTPDG